MELQRVKQRFGIIGNSARLNYALEVAIKVATTDITVYIQGESGVGKESFSKIIHQLSSRKHGAFIAINCGAIPEGTINSELFGHEKGAFTGAHDARKGYFETANGGTIFLDEVGELPLETQSRLLRVLENGEFIRVGSSKVQKTDVRVVAATNKDLYEESKKGKFREDLYYRLSVLPIKVPALRERQQDVILLFNKFAYDLAEKYHTPLMELSSQAEQVLMGYRWPGNIRQLKNITEQMAVLESNPTIDTPTLKKYMPADFDVMLPATIESANKESGKSGFSERDIFYKVLFDLKSDMTDLKKIVLELLKSNKSGDEIIEDNQALMERIWSENVAESSEEMVITPRLNRAKQQTEEAEDVHEPYVIESEHNVSMEENLSLEAKEEELIRKALLKNNGKRKKAAQDLGISERTLYRKIKEYGID
jgi:DNA-binding NtrC family response regulator